MSSSKSLSSQRFGDQADAYVRSPIHATGADLERLLELADPQPDWLVLDVATGGGHTARVLAPYVARVIASDLTPRMLMAARATLPEGVAVVVSDAERLSFPVNTFDLVTCRIAAHHFPDSFTFVRECARILKPGGRLVIQDHDAPEDEAAARYVDAFERLRDPSHVQAYAGYQWEGMYLDAGLTVDHIEQMRRSAGGLITWAERQRCSSEVIEKLRVLLVQAPEAVRAFLRPRHAHTPDADFDHCYVLVAGHKPSR